MKYKILFNYGSEGWRFEKQEFDTVDEAAKHAIDTCMSAPFEIVIVVEWKATEEERWVNRPSPCGAKEENKPPLPDLTKLREAFTKLPTDEDIIDLYTNEQIMGFFLDIKTLVQAVKELLEVK